MVKDLSCKRRSKVIIMEDLLKEGIEMKEEKIKKLERGLAHAKTLYLKHQIEIYKNCLCNARNEEATITHDYEEMDRYEYCSATPIEDFKHMIPEKALKEMRNLIGIYHHFEVWIDIESGCALVGIRTDNDEHGFKIAEW